MAFDLMSLVAKLTLDSSEYEKGLGDAEKQGGGFGKGVAKAAKGVSIAVAAVTTATAAAGGAFIKGASSAADYGDNIDKMSQKMGLSAEKYQEWDAIMQHTGTSIEALKPSMKTLANAAEKGAEEFERLGLTQEQVANMSQEELFEATIAGLQNVEDTTERTYLAGKLLGRGATELGALLNTSAEDTEAMRQRVHELGGVMSDEAVKASARYKDSLQDMQTAMAGVKRNILASFLPALADAMDGLGNLFSGAIDKGQEQIRQGVSGFIQKMTEAIPRFLEIGKAVISALGQAVIENLPTLLDAGVQAVIQIAQGISESLPTLIPSTVEAVLTMVDTLLDNVDMLVDAALQLMMGLAEGIINALPIIVEKLPTIIEGIVNALIRSIPKIADAGVKLLGSLVKNLPAIIAQIIKAIPTIITGIGREFLSAMPSMIQIGVNLMHGIGQGILSGVSSVINSVISAAKNIVESLKNALGIHSPSKITMGFGEMLDKGLAEGITKHKNLAQKAMQGISEIVEDPMGMTLDMDSGGGSGEMEQVLAFDTGNAGGDAGRDITVILQLDRTQLARTVFRLNNEETQRVGLNLSGGIA